MLVSLLRSIAATDGFVSLSRLAAEVGATTASVRTMIDDLARLGYLEAAPTECLSRGCGSTCGGCAVTRSARGWSLTDKGQRFIAHSA
jgi:DNA-binding IclR family transcriptional regulator